MIRLRVILISIAGVLAPAGCIARPAEFRPPGDHPASPTVAEVCFMPPTSPLVEGTGVEEVPGEGDPAEGVDHSGGGGGSVHHGHHHRGHAR